MIDVTRPSQILDNSLESSRKSGLRENVASTSVHPTLVKCHVATTHATYLLSVTVLLPKLHSCLSKAKHVVSNCLQFILKGENFVINFVTRPVYCSYK